MAKARSPQYPAISLKDAVEKVTAVYNKDYQNPLPRAVAAQHMGYQSLNGNSLGALSAVGKFGLMEGRGNDFRVSDLAVVIIAHPPGTPERVAALKDAAGRPELFAELDGKYSNGRVSDQTIRSYLLTQKFLPSAADIAIRSYRETKQLVESEGGAYSEFANIEQAPMHSAETATLSRPASPQERPNQPPAARVNAPYESTWTPASGAPPFRVSFIGGGAMEVAATITSPNDADDLVRAINALKMLLQPVGSGKRPTDEDTQSSE